MAPLGIGWERIVNAFAVANSTSAPVAADTGVVRRALAWMRRQPADGRAEAVNALARAFLHCGLPDAVRAEAMLALTSVLDDLSVPVRRALADALAGAVDAPRHIILALACDQSEVARIVLARSPLLEDAELVDCAAIGDAAVQTAIARRAGLGAGVAAAIAEIGEKGAVLALADNLQAELRPMCCARSSSVSATMCRRARLCSHATVCPPTFAPTSPRRPPMRSPNLLPPVSARSAPRRAHCARPANRPWLPSPAPARRRN